MENNDIIKNCKDCESHPICPDAFSEISCKCGMMGKKISKHAQAVKLLRQLYNIPDNTSVKEKQNANMYNGAFIVPSDFDNNYDFSKAPEIDFASLYKPDESEIKNFIGMSDSTNQNEHQ